MGLGIAIGGSIAALTVFVIILTYPMVSEKLVETTNARSEILAIDNKFQKTGLDIPVLLAANGESIINFTLNSFGMEKLWNFDDFVVLVNYDADIAGTSTPTIEQVNFDVDSSFLGSTVSFDTLSRPDTDEAQGGWDDTCPSCDTDAELFDEIDETARDDSDFVTSDLLNFLGETDTFEVGLSDIPDPLTSSGHEVKYTIRKDGSGGVTVDFTVRLLEGGTEISSWPHADVSDTFTLFTQTLSASEANAITDYSDLRLEFTAEYDSGIAPFRRGEVSWASFEVPQTNANTNEVNCSTNTSFNSGDWIIANVTDDSLDPKIINQNEVSYLCIRLSNPVFAGGNVLLNIATDIGHTVSKSTTAS